jgi:hypothetical protein
MVADFTASTVPSRSDGQVDRAAQRLGLIAAAGELATAMGLVPWRKGEARGAAAWALAQWIEGRGGTEPAVTVRPTSLPPTRPIVDRPRIGIAQGIEAALAMLFDRSILPLSI